MTYGDDSFSNPGSASVMARLKRLVSGSTHSPPGPAASAVLARLHATPPDERAPQAAPEPMRIHDPNREAAMNAVRRLRIRSA